MSEVIYSKKQIQPLVEKFSINVEKDETFNIIINMFPNQANYQVWAIKAVFGRECPLRVIQDVKVWADENKQEIKNLIKGNIVAYTKKHEFMQLIDEIKGLNMISTIKRVINQFNTDQRKILSNVIFDHISNGIDACASKKINEWFKISKGVETLNQKNKQTLIVSSSALRDYSELYEMISKSYIAKYQWNREDLLNYAKVNTPDCDVIYDNDNVVILQVPSFESSKTLCGHGKTGWCLTRQEFYFKQYVSEKSGASQYFLFNFNLKDTHDFARIGFTVVNSRGITNAHSSTNRNLLSNVTTDDGRTENIDSILRGLNIDKGMFMRLKKLTRYSWSEADFLKYISNTSIVPKIVFERDKILILKFDNYDAMRQVASHTYIDLSGDTNSFLLFNFGVSQNDSNSILKISVDKDKYGIESIKRVIDSYNADITNTKVLNSLHIEIDDFISRKDIDPNLLFHKLIDEGNESRAIELLNTKDVNVNFNFENNFPIFKIIDKKYINLFRAVVSNPNFDASIKDAMGEPILLSLMCRYKAEKNRTSEISNIKQMINIILDNENYDFNAKDLNYDTAVNFAAEYPMFGFILKKLVENPKVNLNIVNDVQCTSLGNAIRRNNLDAIKLLGKRADLIVRDQDKKMAESRGINLDAYIQPEIDGSSSNGLETNDLTSDLVSLFAKVFNLEI